MTLIIATPFNQGVMVAYDTVRLMMPEFTYLDYRQFIPNGHCRKFEQVSKTRIGLGIAGYDSDDQFHWFSASIQGKPDHRKFLDQFIANESPSARRYVCTSPGRNGIEILVGPTIESRKPVVVPFGAVGSVDKEVREYLEKNHDPSRSQAHSTDFLLAAFRLAFDLNKAKSDYHIGKVLQGFGLVKVTPDAVEQLRFDPKWDG